jgi:RimJ/RimL family protein N-acetyltransferase
VLYFWRNHPSTRRYFYNKNPICFDDHKIWFEGALKRDDTFLYIVESVQEGPLGVVRFELIGNCAEVHIYLVPEKQGHGFGAKVLNTAIVEITSKYPINSFNAHVLPQNVASIKIFKRAGFSEEKNGLFCKKYDID